MGALGPDQILAIENVLKSMQKPVPMDHLVCGDVGFGKTEIAMRAAFKAVEDKKQVAILVPTTILALQHFHSFIQRFQDFPVRIEFLSRFKTAKESKQILEELLNNKIDIVIGTHKLLSNKVEFYDLGLVIVDEEQRFGVGHKEKLKLLKSSVDFLTLTATPIPRTMQMAFLGLRDLSLIQFSDFFAPYFPFSNNTGTMFACGYMSFFGGVIYHTVFDPHIKD